MYSAAYLRAIRIVLAFHGTAVLDIRDDASHFHIGGLSRGGGCHVHQLQIYGNCK